MTLTLPSWYIEHRPHQLTAVDEIEDAFRSGARVVVLEAPTGCLVGSTKININRGGKGFTVDLKTLVTCFNGGERKWTSANGGQRSTTWDLSTPTRVQCEVNGYVRLGNLKHAWNSGVKDTLILRTMSSSVQASYNHPFLTLDGTYTPMQELTTASCVAVKGERGFGASPKKYYKYVSGCKLHPYATHLRRSSKADGWRVPTHRLVAEAQLNELSTGEFTQRVRTGPIEGLQFLDPAVYAVHHIDGNSINNDPSNLEVLDHVSHWRQEGEEKTWKNCAYPIVYKKVISIEEAPKCETYDLELEHDPHNFIADGFVVHNSGKTLIAETVRQRLGVARTAYTCSTKSLQDQFARDYPYAKVLKGRNNYPTELYPDRFGLRWDSLSCEDCTKNLTADKSCGWCSSVSACPYEMAKDEAVHSTLSVINTSYLLSEANYVGRFSGLDLVIADECDLLDQAVIGFVSVEISARRVKQLGIGTPRKVTVRESWLEWVEQAGPVVKEKARIAREKARKGPSSNAVREANYLSGLWSKIATLRKGIDEGGWIYTGTRERVEFKPVWATDVGEEVLWSHGKRWLLMSATVINAENMLSNLGYQNRFGIVNSPSTFPVANRPIIYRPVANMKGSGESEEREAEWAKLIPAIEQIRSSHAGERILVHTVSYSLAEFLSRAISGRVVTYTNSTERQQALDTFLSTPGAIFFAPSMDRGIDLPDDACRVQVVAKVPFANLGDKQVNARLYGSGQRGRLWYTTEAIRTLVQMCGRGVRHEEDRCVTYILDFQFEWKLHNSNRHLFPRWWRDALQWKK